MMERQEARMEDHMYFRKRLGAHPLLIVLVCLILSGGSNLTCSFAQTEHWANKAVCIKILGCTFAKDLAGKKTPPGKIFAAYEVK